MSGIPEDKLIGQTLDLRTCPFCGGLPGAQTWHGGAATKVRIGCSNDGCEVGPAVTGETPAEAARNWNHRVSPGPRDPASYCIEITEYGE